MGQYHGDNPQSWPAPASLSTKGARGALAVGASLAGAALTVGSFAAPAGATLTAPANTTIIGSGSATTYLMMQQMDLLFNDCPGCQQFVRSPRRRPHRNWTSAARGPQTLAKAPSEPVQRHLGRGAPDRVQQRHRRTRGPGCPRRHGDQRRRVDQRGGHPELRPKLPCATSGDLKGLNFVAYAADAVPWFHFTEVRPATATPSSGITNADRLPDPGHLERHVHQLGPGRRARRADRRLCGPGGFGHPGHVQDVTSGFDPSAQTNR